MFETLRGFVADLIASPGDRRTFDDNDHRLAAAVLLVHVADADGGFDEAENGRLRGLLAAQFDLDEVQTRRLVREAQQIGHESAGVDHFVNVLRRMLDADGRLRLVEMMWDMVYADGEANETEDSVIWRIAGMLGVSEADQETLRRAEAGGRWPGASARRGSE